MSVIEVTSGVISSGLTLNSKLSMEIYSSGKAYETTIRSGGTLTVYEGGWAEWATIYSGGEQYVSKGGYADATSVYNEGYFTVCSGASTYRNRVYSGGRIFVHSDAKATTTWVYSSGVFAVEKGGSSYVAYILEGGDVSIYGIGEWNDVEGGRLLVGYGGTATSNTVSSGGVMLVYSDGVATSNTILAGGVYIYSGGTANSTTLTGYGSDIQGKALMQVQGTANSTTIGDNAFMAVTNGTNQRWSGGHVNDTVINSGGRLDVTSGSVAQRTTVNEGGVVNLSGGRATSNTVQGGVLNVFSNGLTYETEVNDGGTMKIIDGGIAYIDTVVNSGGVLEVFSGGDASNTTIYEGGVFNVFSAGDLSGATISSGGTATIYEDVMATDVLVNGGLFVLESGGWAYRSSKGSTVSSNTIVQSGGSAVVHGDAWLWGAEVLYGGIVEVMSDGTFDTAKVSSGTVSAYNGACVSRVNLEEGGVLIVESGGSAQHINVSSGGVLTGVLREASELRFYEGTLDLNISNAASDNEFLVDEISYNNITPLQNYTYFCTLTIDNSQDAGTYNLIEGATGFDKGITVKNTQGENLGTLTLGGETITIGALDYTLNQAVDGSLSVSIAQGSGGQGGDGPDPMPILPDAFFTGDFNGAGYDMLAVRYDSMIYIYQNGERWGSLTLDYGWSIAGVGDFNGDGSDDFLRVNTEGYVVGEMSNGNGTFSPQVLNFLNEGWDILGIGDFDSTGYDDVLIANPTAASDIVGLIGYWEGGATWTLINGYSAEWDMISTGDFNGDGNCDMLWKNSFIGDDGNLYNAYCTWLVGLPEEPTSAPQDWFIVSVANPDEWNFLCAGDFDGDKTNDIAMINIDGVVGIWGVQDGMLSSWSILSAVTPEWQLAGVADFNGDGTDDIAWCSSTTGQVGAWIVQDKELSNWQVLANIGY